MAIISNLVVRAGADFSQLQRQLNTSRRQLQDFNRTIGASMKIAGAALGIGLGYLVKEGVEAAMDVESSILQINRLMGTSAEEFKHWGSDSSIAFNLSRQEALKYGAVYANLLSTFSSSNEETMNNTRELLKASAITAAATGRTMEDTLFRIRSGLLGNTEAIEDLGINVYVNMLESTKAFKAFANGKSWDQLDFNVQSQIRHMAILEQIHTKYGNTLANTTASAQQLFIANLKNLRLNLGEAFLPIYATILPALTNLVVKLIQATATWGAFMRALFGIKEAQKVSTKGSDAQASAVTDLGKAYDKAGKKAKGSVAGFDEVNQLADPSTDGAGTGAGTGVGATSSGGGTSDIKMPEIDTTLIDKARESAEKLREKLKAAFEVIKEYQAPIAIILGALGTGLLTVGIKALTMVADLAAIKAILNILKASFMFLLTPIGLIILAIGALVTAFVYFYNTSDPFKKFVDTFWDNLVTGTMAIGAYIRDVFVGIWTTLSDTISWLYNTILVPIGSFISGVFNTAWKILTTTILWLYNNVLKPVGDFVLKSLSTMWTPLANILKDTVSKGFETVSKIAKSFYDNVLVPMGQFFKTVFIGLIETVSTVLGFLWRNVFKPAGEFLETVFMKVLEILGETFTWLWENAIKPLGEKIATVLTPIIEDIGAIFTWLNDEILEPIRLWIADTFVKIFDTVFKLIGGYIDGLKTGLDTIMKWIQDTFSSDWNKAWTNISDLFSKIFDGVKTVFKGVINSVIDGINFMIRSINKVKIKIPAIPGITEGRDIGFTIPEIPHLAKGGITNGAMMAVVGDNVGGREVVSPLSDLKDMLISAVTSAMALNQNPSSTANNREIVLNVDGVKLARVLIPAMDKENSRIGNRTIIQGV